jgi:hypothetical protein
MNGFVYLGHRKERTLYRIPDVFSRQLSSSHGCPPTSFASIRNDPSQRTIEQQRAKWILVRFSYLVVFLGLHTSMAENQPAEQHQLEDVNGREPQAADKSGALFSMYLERADDDDNKVTERWNKECGAILIFVGILANWRSNKTPLLMLNIVDWSFLSSSRSSSCRFCLGSSAESTRYDSDLRRKYLSSTC